MHCRIASWTGSGCGGAGQLVPAFPHTHTQPHTPVNFNLLGLIRVVIHLPHWKQDRKLDQRRLRELANFFQPYEAAARRGGGSGGARAAHRGGTRITIRLPSRGRLVPGCIIVPSGICRPAQAATWLPLASPTLGRRRSCPPATAWRLTWWLTAPPAYNCPPLACRWH